MKFNKQISEKYIIKNTNLLDRFLNYVKIDSQSNFKSNTFPSTKSQIEFGKILVKELIEIGLKDAHMDEYGYVYGTLKANSKSRKVVTFISHMDVAIDCKGTGVKPLVHKNYNGEIIKLKGVNIDPKEFPNIKKYIGKTIITSDGTTLLGADDKAGIANIMTVLEIFNINPKLNHGKIKVCFTPDEELGKSCDHIDLAKIKADFVYSIDGGLAYEVDFECFNAVSAEIDFKGKSIHPGYAKGKMISAVRNAAKFVSMLPDNLTPEHTENREPFIMIVNMNGTVEKAKIHAILRGFEEYNIEDQKQLLKSIKQTLIKMQPGLKINIKFRETYKNLKNNLMKNPQIRGVLNNAAKNLGKEIDRVSVRGGFDGSHLSALGFPSPNIFAGQDNCHSKTERACLEDMANSVELLIEVVNVINKI